jgi:MYXO-CTERM domain-containing protein
VRSATLVSSSLTVVFLVLGSVGHAAAAPCNKPDLRDAMPPDGANTVPTNATLSARYATNATYLDEEVIFEHVGVGEEAVSPSYNEAEGILKFVPDPPLVAGDSYIVTWPRLRGLNASNLGKGATVHFTVGATSDEEPPSFAGLTGLDWDVDRYDDECTDSLEDRYIFDFDLAAASDDGGRESLTLLVFQTQGANVDPNAPDPVMVRRIPPSGESARLTKTLDDGAGDVCFAAITRDLTGKTSPSGANEVCTETVKPPFFEGCSVGREGRPGSVFVLALALAGLFLRRRAA